MKIDKALMIQAFFQDQAFENTWADMKHEYETLGFRDNISDEIMIAEFKYIAQQLRKYKFSKQDQIVNKESVEDMMHEVESLIGKASEYGNTRAEIVYNFLRDHWLIDMYNALARVKEFGYEEEDEDA